MSDYSKFLEEKLREASCIGDVEAVQKLLFANVNINSQNAMNGWSALHWAAKRNHVKIVDLLLKHGADKKILTNEGKLPCQLSTSKEIINLLRIPNCGEGENKTLPFIPHYLENPPLHSSNHFFEDIKVPNLSQNTSGEELVLKARIKDHPSLDFIEIELDKNNLSYDNLVKACCKEFQIFNYESITIKKLPDTKIRKDKDVLRLENYQEIEVTVS